ncbi:MAG TPA: hypothetical protein ENN17_04685, partial [bacterium]|nr:hypothetical protein [bacterium]
MKRTAFIFASIFLVLLVSTAAFGQGGLRGVVADSLTARPLAGANVYLVGTAFGSATDLDGNYRIDRVPPGAYTLRISYIGYHSKDIEIVIQHGRTAIENAELSQDVVLGETVVVTGQAVGQAAAINQQITSNTIINVVSEEKIKELPDANAAESVGRLPGVSLMRSGGEANRVILRGLEDKFTVFTIDGVKIPPTDATRAAEWANTGEVYKNGNNKITWIFSAPNDVTQWTVRNNFFTIGDSGQAFLDDFQFGIASPLSDHIQEKLGAAAADAFTQVDLTLANTPGLMTNTMRWYEDPLGANKLKDQTNWVTERDDYDRRVIEYYRDTFDCSYSAASIAYSAADGNFPVGDLNWFPALKAQWEQGEVRNLLNLAVDAEKDAFYETLTGPDDGYLQLRSYAFNDNGEPDDDDDLSAKIWTAWDEDWFYLYQEVMDDIISGNASNVWENDCIELKFDPEPTDSTQGGTSIWDTRLTALGPDDEGVVSSDNLNNVAAENKQFARKIIPGGYALELAIHWSAIASGNGETVDVGEGNIFGLAINQHDNDGTAARVASVMWGAVMLDAAWNT